MTSIDYVLDQRIFNQTTIRDFGQFMRMAEKEATKGVGEYLVNKIKV